MRVATFHKQGTEGEITISRAVLKHWVKVCEQELDEKFVLIDIPDCIVVEAIKKLAMSDNAKRRLQAWQDTREEESDSAVTFWRERLARAA